MHTAVLQVSAEDLRDDELFEDLQEDIAEECNSYGTVRSIVIPRPAQGESAESVDGAGTICSRPLHFLSLSLRCV